MTIMVETVAPPEIGQLNLTFNLIANIQITSTKARRLVSVFVGNHIADLLHGEMPNLVVCLDGIYWRVPVILSSLSLGRIGAVGTVDVDVETGDLRVNEQIIKEIKQNARRFASSASL